METANSITIEQIKTESSRFKQLYHEVAKVIVGHHETVTYSIIALLCNGHILLEGVPGVAKTTLIKAIAQALGLTFKRIQFTPDLLPSDVIGTLIFNPKTNDFETKKGPIFTHLLLADEINRSPAKVQSALLEAMQEQQVTIGATTFALEKPFLVFATQNPLEQEGTYRLPEAQVDRFLFKVLIDYPTYEQEKKIITQHHDTAPAISPIISHNAIVAAQELLKSIYIDERVINYIVSLVFATREPERYGLKSIKPFIEYGVSPRASIALYNTSKAHALLQGRHFVTPDDIKAVIYPVLRHRLYLTFQAEAEAVTADQIITTILQTVIVP